jgi:mono/diheme cytochrome c family protein
MSRFSLAFAVLAGAALAACDNREAIHEPDPTWARMLTQRRASPFRATSAFADGKVMQMPPPGTVPIDDDSDTPPPAVTPELLKLGRARFDAVCAVCHGITGDGHSVVATKMELRPPPSIVNAENRARSREGFYKIATEGYGLMASYADRLSREERWAIVAYIQALQLSRQARAAKLPPPLRERLAREAP